MSSESINKGDIEPGNILEIYSEFGYRLGENSSSSNMPKVSRERIREIYGNVSNELLYLSSIDAIELEEDGVRLRPSEAGLANKINRLECQQNIMAHDLAGEYFVIPEYISNPEIEEEFNDPVEIDQNPSQELVARLLNAIDPGEELNPEEIEEEMTIDTTADIGSWLTYLETQDLVESRTSGYALRDVEEVERFLNAEKEHAQSLKQQHRYSEEPFKP